ncbi:translation machinery-associated protein 16 [Lophiotrema nucula]|uniref:Translation machinery-associated protein 16 n=1 Tax=Lophiotrema nucula TaxID=690887 RepID=A0A6A5ZRD8_9PLEO|nr:translation machinery-associated protein 16 [Lophiotrema nucula]
MGSNKLHKVQKHVQKKKGKNPNLHENSRDTQRLQRASARDDKVNRLTAIREKQNRPYLLRVKYFQTCAESRGWGTFTTPETQILIDGYLQRDNEELAAIQAERRPGRPPSTRETLLKQAQAQEQGEYISGYWVPHLEDAETLKQLKDWSGQWSGLNQLKFIRVTKEGVRKESAFPPKGLS